MSKIRKEEPEWKKRLKRIEEANKKRGKKHGFARKTKQDAAKRGKFTTRKRTICDMCGKLIHVRDVKEGSLDTGTNYCKQCAKARGV